MLSFSNDLLYIFNWRYYVVFGYILFLVAIVLSDIRYRYTVKIALNLNLKREDVIFFIFVLSVIVLFLFNIKFEFIEQWLSIIDYNDARHTILRIKIIRTLFLVWGSLAILMSILCGAIAAKFKMGFLKWFVYGLFLNALAFIYLLNLWREQKINQKKEENG